MFINSTRKSCFFFDKVDRPKKTIWRMRLHAGQNATNTHTHSEYVILIAFPLQQWLHESASTLRLYINCLASFVLTAPKLLRLSLNWDVRNPNSGVDKKTKLLPCYSFSIGKSLPTFRVSVNKTFLGLIGPEFGGNIFFRNVDNS